ncbi:hypothetical protein RD110_18745 [Rhodoferax koreense]|uniref:Uncharacterized protein n=1 Tax=Rhodoferax koreensis TaxID=1842727 RepID=A0A1P8JZ14_9BURK|nr:hypothetical protein [Rhodoferax koreense]APW38993.1 hypothetical protein RD110_18745 [Rhodoferax koreense]
MFIEVLTPDEIKREAQTAVVSHDNVNDACRFPFDSEAGRIFREEFLWIRSVLNAKATADAEKAPR